MGIALISFILYHLLKVTGHSVPRYPEIRLAISLATFEQAQQLWLDSLRVEIQAKSAIEPRFMVIGKIKLKVDVGLQLLLIVSKPFALFL